MAIDLTTVSLAINIGTLCAVVYLLRETVVLHRKIEGLMKHQGVKEAVW
jgi:hypothetical protein